MKRGPRTSRWSLSTLGDVARLDMGQSPNGQATNTNGKGTPLIGGAADYKNGRIEASRFTVEPTKLCQEDDLILCIRATIGRVAVADKVYCLGRGVAGLRPSKVTKDFLRYFLVSQQKAMDEAGTGTTFRQIDKRTLSSWSIPLPDRETQQRVVEKLDKLMELSRSAREDLGRVPRLVERYKKAVLSAVMESDESGRPWPRVPLETLLIDGPTNGYSPRAGENPKGTLSLKLTATTRGVFDLSEKAVKRLNEIVPKESKYWLRPGDILIQRANSLDYVGMTAIYDGPLNQFIYPDLMIRIRVSSRPLARWIWRYCSSAAGRNYFISNATGTAGNMPKINGTTIRKMPIPIPPLDRLDYLLERVDRALDSIEILRAEAGRGQLLLDRLEQSALSKAFRGDFTNSDKA